MLHLEQNYFPGQSRAGLEASRRARAGFEGLWGVTCRACRKVKFVSWCGLKSVSIRQFSRLAMRSP